MLASWNLLISIKSKTNTIFKYVARLAENSASWGFWKVFTWLKILACLKLIEIVRVKSYIRASILSLKPLVLSVMRAIFGSSSCLNVLSISEICSLFDWKSCHVPSSDSWQWRFWMKFRLLVDHWTVQKAKTSQHKQVHRRPPYDDLFC